MHAQWQLASYQISSGFEGVDIVKRVGEMAASQIVLFGLVRSTMVVYLASGKFFSPLEAFGYGRSLK